MFRVFLFVSTIIFSTVFNDRTDFYNALSGESAEEIDKIITKLENEKKSPMVNAYLGALYMKKSGFLRVPAEKLELFRKGQQMLDHEIELQPQNTEMRFVRLIMQEKSPKMLKYNSNIQEDKAIILKNFSKLDRDLKNFISDFAVTSKYLKPEELK